jgi:electron transfer flavoprotein alpha subunit
LTAEHYSAKRIWVWAEQREGSLLGSTLEVVAEARKLADQLGVQVAALLLGHNVDDQIRGLAQAGADVVYVIDSASLDSYSTEPYAAVIAALGHLDGAPNLLLCAQTVNGADLAPRIAARFGASFLNNCVCLRPSDGWLRVIRTAYLERVHQEWLVPLGRSLVVTFRVHITGQLPIDSGRIAKVLHRPMPPIVNRVRRLRTLPPDPQTMALADSERIVAAGLGIGSKEFLSEVQALADALDATLGATRPLADRGWIAFERQIGSTGQMVSPKLYVALGISGALQHVAGIIGTETMIAVNTDPAAPIMAMATVGVVGDVRDIVPRLTARIRRSRPGRHGLEA